MHLEQEGRNSPAVMAKKRKRQVLDDTGSRSLHSACRRLSCIGSMSVDWRQQQHSAALWATKQPSLWRALLAPPGDGLRKGGLNKAYFTPTWFGSRGQRAYLPSSKKNEREKKTANLELACWDVRTMQDSEDRPQRRSALVARELAQLDIDIAALSEERFVEQGFLREDGVGYTVLVWEEQGRARPL